MTSNRGKERLRLSLKRRGILGQTNTTITGLGETMLGNQGLPILRQLSGIPRTRTPSSREDQE